MSRRTLEDVRVETMIAERSGMLLRAAEHRVSVERAVQSGKFSADEGAMVIRQVAIFAECCAIGLHVDGDTPAAVRDALRPLVKGMGNG